MCSLLATKSTASTTSLIVIFMGPPGAGKGTHAGPLSEHLDIPHISTGDLFRNNIRMSTPLGKIANSYISEGKLVPDELTLDMLFHRLSQDDCKKGCILDGFPRTVSQAEAFEKRLDATSKLVVLHLCIDDPPIIERIIGRLACKDCGTPYHSRFNPPVQPGRCNKCQGFLYQRDDDTEAVVRKRLEVYRAQTKPVIDYYAEKEGLLRAVCGMNQPEVVFETILTALCCTEYTETT
jgi:adenylate kinase